MKLIFSLALLAATTPAFAAALKKTVTWNSQDSQPVWDALNVTVSMSKSIPSYEVKSVGPVTCMKTKKAQGDDYSCSFPTKLKDAEIQALYNALDVKPWDMETQEPVKTVGKLLVLSGYNEKGEESALFLDHACQSVSKKEEAQACMDFLTQNIFSEEEGGRPDAIVVEATPEVKALAVKLDVALTYTDAKRTNDDFDKALATADYAVIQAEYSDEQYITYWTLSNGKNVLPTQYMVFNTVDVEYLNVGVELKKQDKKDYDKFVKDFFNTLYLGLPDQNGSMNEQTVADGLEELFNN